MKTVSIFSVSPRESAAGARRREAWQHVIFLEEADRRKIAVSREELEKELKRLVAEKDIAYGSLRYFDWVRKTFDETSDVFERHLENLLKVKKLIEAVKAEASPATPQTTQQALESILTQASLKDFISDVRVTMETTAGAVELKLYADVAPKAVENFTRLAEKGYYDGLSFHRVIKGFMIQGGDPNGDGTGGKSIWGEPFEDETYPDVKFDKKGLLAMANSGPHTNGSQFFITLAPTPHLNGRHTIFGEVVSGMEVVEAIGSTAVDGDDRPLADQKIVKITVKK
ncbi:MAG TPA: peptidylprolyl isomerase [Candidatus Eisenbacteria bacterium]|nr:peptidylprolyl isomerase [Candidatus Eisenbacteria bacterium]